MLDDDAATAKILPLEQHRESAQTNVHSHPCIGWLVVDGEQVLVDFHGNPDGPRPARWLSGVARPARAEVEVLLLFDGGQLDCPIVVGLLAPSAPPVDDGRVALEGRDELTLSCGEASLVLRRNGRVVISGALVEARSSGRTRILGTTVEIN